MKASEIEQTVRAELTNVAPEVNTGSIDPDKSFRDQFDLDSMDDLALMMALDDQLRIRIPEFDYPKLSSLSGCVQYLAEKLNAPATEA